MIEASEQDEVTVATGHVLSPFFTMLPIELRLMIYAEAFAGSQNDLHHWQSPMQEEYTSGQMNEMEDRFGLRPSQHHELLFVCRRLYEEALAVYWSQTAVYMGGLDIKTGACAMLCTIPVHARPYIQHITGVKVTRGGTAHNARRCGYFWTDNCGKWWFTKMLRHLPRLRTCILTDCIRDMTDPDVIQNVDQDYWLDKYGHGDMGLHYIGMCREYWDRIRGHGKIDEKVAAIGYPGIVLQKLHLTYWRDWDTIPDGKPGPAVVRVSIASQANCIKRSLDS